MIVWVALNYGWRYAFFIGAGLSLILMALGLWIGRRVRDAGEHRPRLWPPLGVDQRERGDNVRLDERRGAVDRAIDMRFRGEIDDRARTMCGEAEPGITVPCSRATVCSRL